MNNIFRVARWLIFLTIRKTSKFLKWVARSLGLTRILGLSVGGGVGAFWGASTGVALGGTAFVGSLFFAPLLAIIGLLVASVAVLSLRQKKSEKELGNLNDNP